MTADPHAERARLLAEIAAAEARTARALLSIQCALAIAEAGLPEATTHRLLALLKAEARDG